MKKFYRISEVANILKVSPSAVRRYVAAGRIECDYTPSGQRVFTQEQVDRFRGVVNGTEGEVSPSKAAFYVRSSDGDNIKLDNQIKLLTKSLDVEPLFVIKDKASGLNDNRKGLKRLFKLAREQEIDTIFVTQKDRLTRFGFAYLEELFSLSGVRIVVVGQDNKQDTHAELMRDFMALIASFSGKFYRLRGYEQQRRLLEEVGKRLE